MEKIHIAKKQFDRNLKRFQCPVCQASMKVIAGSSILCKKGHTFDFAKQGYLNLLGAGNNRIYDKTLFKARRDVMEAGFYRKPVQKIEEIIKNYGKTEDGKKGLILDAGCGEGYYLRSLAAEGALREDYEFCGVDISKEGIALAAKSGEDAMWCVADLTKLPFKTQSIDVMLNILTPAHYGEFKRTLAKRGIIVKIMPEEGYLREIRERIGIHPEKKVYDNTEVISHVQKHIKIMEQCRITYENKVNRYDFAGFVNMTPLTANLKQEERERLLEEAIPVITIDFTIVVGR